MDPELRKHRPMTLKREADRVFHLLLLDWLQDLHPSQVESKTITPSYTPTTKQPTLRLSFPAD